MRAFSVGLLIVGLPALGACTAHRPPAPEALECRPISGPVEALLQGGAVVLLGEIHGTAESPAFLIDLLCHALRAGRSVSVGLEIPIEETDRVDTFLASAGAEPDRARFLQSPFWDDAYQDGRRSRAMLGVFDTLRRWRAAGHVVRVGLLDAMDLAARPAERDRTMGQRLAALHTQDPEGVVVALLGNVHSRVERGSPWSKEYEAAGFHLSRALRDVRLTALDLSRVAGGSAWFCTSADPASCGERPLRGGADAGTAAGRSISLHSELLNGHHGVYTVGALTASPPARGR